MVLIHNYALAVFFFVAAMTCWGSWSNTQKLGSKKLAFRAFLLGRGYWVVDVLTPDGRLP